ncbi:MAG: response regulator transcription factor [Desulfobulbus sp.]|uniref:response regulator transcription factor n=1 Tax=Desulfobulbus sp. TaxID=895 RepID=UPI00283EDC05|nr:response regulator transcription factor [Desulfobulbus sp.]MDR2550619.1 response regulator transcription factor [Desulfobulbus sp.]
MNQYRIAIADDHCLIRQGLKSLIGTCPSLSIVAEADNGSELLEKLQRHRPDMVILDITMPQLNGIEALRKIRERYPNMAVLILTMHSGGYHFYQAMTAGAHGYLIKDDSESELLAAIGTIREGRPYISSQLAPEVTDEVIAKFRGDAKMPFYCLSDREKEVLCLVMQGHSSRTIGERLGISPRTIDHHRASLLKKFKMKNTVDLVNHVASSGMRLSDKET